MTDSTEPVNPDPADDWWEGLIPETIVLPADVFDRLMAELDEG